MSTSSANATGLPNAIHAFDHLPRRSFLAGLANLPLIGGSVALLGRPSAVAEPTTPDMLEAYKTWLEYERRWLSWEMAGDPLWQSRYRAFASPDDRVALSHQIDGCFDFIGDINSYHDEPSKRAALILSAVGCDWRNRENHAARRRA